MSDCVKRIIEKSNGVFDKQSAKKLLDDVKAVAAKKARAGFDEDDAVKDVLIEYAANVKQNIEKQKLNTYRNLAKNKALGARLDAHVEAGLSLDKAMIAEMEGTEKGITGARYSADQAAQAIEQATLGKFINDLGDLLPVLNSRKFTKEIANELRILEDGNGKPSGNKQAKQIAEIIQKNKEISRIRANRAGADIEKVDGHTMLQTHDPYKMRKMGQQGWIDFIKPLINEKTSFGGADDLDAALRGAYKRLTTGIRLDNPMAVKEPKLFQFEGPANLGKKMSRARQLHFKDADSFLAYNTAMGKADFNDTIISMFTRQANDIALLERYGTNPEAQLKTAYDQLAQRHRDEVSVPLDETNLESIIEQTVGNKSLPTTAAKIGSNIRLYQSVRLLGAVVISSFNDIVNKTFAYQWHGKSVLSSYVQPFLDLAEGFKSKQERIEFASLIGVGMEGMIGDIAGRFSEVDTLSRKAQKASRLYFKLNGLSWWTDTHKLAMGKVFSHDLALKKALPFDKLDADTKRIFNQYTITAKDWDVIRQTGLRKMNDGREYVFAEGIKDQAVADKLTAYYIDSVEHGVLSPGNRERRYTALGTERGTKLGEAVRVMMQFKTFPTTVVTRTWGRALYGKGKADIPMMIQLMVMTSAFGYMAMSAKDLIKGKTPKDPAKAETIMASVAQGGGFSIAGDIAFGTRGLANVAIGPTGSQADDLVKVLQSAREGNDVQANLTRQGINAVTPNLFYVKPALDSLIRAHVYEELNPGYTARMEQKMKKDYGQEFYK